MVIPPVHRRSLPSAFQSVAVERVITSHILKSAQNQAVTGVRQLHRLSRTCDFKEKEATRNECDQKIRLRSLFTADSCSGADSSSDFLTPLYIAVSPVILNFALQTATFKLWFEGSNDEGSPYVWARRKGISRYWYEASAPSGRSSRSNLRHRLNSSIVLRLGVDAFFLSFFWRFLTSNHSGL